MHVIEGIAQMPLKWDSPGGMGKGNGKKRQNKAHLESCGFR